MPKTSPVFTIEARNLRGMVRQREEGNLPANVARLHLNGRLQDLNAKRRPGCVRVATCAEDAGGLVTLNGTDEYGDWPDNAAYDLGTKWAILLWAKTAGTPGGTQYLFSRNVNPDTAGKLTARVSINTSRQLGFQMHAGGTAYDLAAGVATAIAAATKAAILVVRNGASLAMYLDGNPTPVVSRSDLPASTPNNAGTTKPNLGRDWDGAAASGYFEGSYGCVVMFRDFASVEDLLKYTTFEKYPDPLDPRVIMYCPFNYGEAAAVMTDWSTLGNDGALYNAPIRADGSSMGAYIRRSQAIFSFGKPYEGSLKNCWLVGGKLLVHNVRAGV